jgi:UDP-glucose 4-epimerase
MDLRRVVLLGHSGFVGRHVAAHLSYRRPGLELIPLSFGDLDLTQAQSVERLTALFTADVSVGVVMTAGIKRQWGDSIDVFSGNLAIAENVSRALAIRPVTRFVFFSSAAVYGETNHNEAIDEYTAVSPSSYYGIAKFASECLLRQSMQQRGFVALRPPLIYGPGDTSESYGPAGFICSALDGETITLWGEGEEKREFIYVGDVAELAARLLFSDFEGPINVVSERQYTFREAAEIAMRLVCRKATIASRPRSKAKVDHGFHNHRLAGLFPEFRFLTLEDGMRRTVEAERRQ